MQYYDKTFINSAVGLVESLFHDFESLHIIPAVGFIESNSYDNERRCLSFQQCSLLNQNYVMKTGEMYINSAVGIYRNLFLRR